MSILIVDDSPDARLLVHGMLTDAGYRNLLSVRSAREAFEHLGIEPSRSAGSHIDLILMDITMPNTDGVEACRLIKAAEHTQEIPIILVTARNKAPYIQKAFEVGATDYVNKPLDRVELLARVRAALKLKQEINNRKSWEEEVSKTVEDMNRTIEQLRALCESIAVCPSCKKIDGDQASLSKLKDYIRTHPDTKVSQTLCLACSS